MWYLVFNIIYAKNIPRTKYIFSLQVIFFLLTLDV